MRLGFYTIAFLPLFLFGGCGTVSKPAQEPSIPASHSGPGVRRSRRGKSGRAGVQSRKCLWGSRLAGTGRTGLANLRSRAQIGSLGRGRVGVRREMTQSK